MCYPRHSYFYFQYLYRINQHQSTLRNKLLQPVHCVTIAIWLGSRPAPLARNGFYAGLENKGGQFPTQTRCSAVPGLNTSVMKIPVVLESTCEAFCPSCSQRWKGEQGEQLVPADPTGDYWCLTISGTKELCFI